MTAIPSLARRVLRHLLHSFWNNLERMALQAQSDTDLPPSAGAATDPKLANLPKKTDDPPEPPEDKPTAKYTLTKDRIFLGPPLGGALCFTFQAITLNTRSSDLSGPFSLLQPS